MDDRRDRRITSDGPWYPASLRLGAVRRAPQAGMVPIELPLGSARGAAFNSAQRWARPIPDADVLNGVRAQPRGRQVKTAKIRPAEWHDSVVHRFPLPSAGFVRRFGCLPVRIAPGRQPGLSLWTAWSPTPAGSSVRLHRSRCARSIVATCVTVLLFRVSTPVNERSHPHMQPDPRPSHAVTATPERGAPHQAVRTVERRIADRNGGHDIALAGLPATGANRLA